MQIRFEGIIALPDNTPAPVIRQWLEFELGTSAAQVIETPLASISISDCRDLDFEVLS